MTNVVKVFERGGVVVVTPPAAPPLIVIATPEGGSGGVDLGTTLQNQVLFNLDGINIGGHNDLWFVPTDGLSASVLTVTGSLQALQFPVIPGPLAPSLDIALLDQFGVVNDSVTAARIFAGAGALATEVVGLRLIIGAFAPTLPKAYGIYIENVDSAASNWAIKTGAGIVEFGDDVHVNTSDTTSFGSVAIVQAVTNDLTGNASLWLRTSGGGRVVIGDAMAVPPVPPGYFSFDLYVTNRVVAGSIGHYGIMVDVTGNSAPTGSVTYGINGVGNTPDTGDVAATYSCYGVSGTAWAYPQAGRTDSHAWGAYFLGGIGGGAGTLGLAVGVGGYVAMYGGTAVEGAAVLADVPTFYGGTVTNLYGLLVRDQTGGTNNWAIKTGLGKVEFGDTVIANKGITFPAASTGQVLLPNGTVAAPSLTFGSDPTTGWYRPASNVWAWSVYGAYPMFAFWANVGIHMHSACALTWDAGDAVSGSGDVALKRNGAGVLEINNSAAGQYRDLRARTLVVGDGVAVNAVEVKNAAGQIGARLRDGALVISYASAGYDAVVVGFYDRTGLGLGNQGGVHFNTSLVASVVSGNIDTSLMRNAAGVLEINNGALGQFRDLRARAVALDPGTVANPSVNFGTVNTGITGTATAVSLIVGGVEIARASGGALFYVFQPNIALYTANAHLMFGAPSDAGLTRLAAGVLGVTDGGPGSTTLRDLKLRNIFGDGGGVDNYAPTLKSFPGWWKFGRVDFGDSVAIGTYDRVGVGLGNTGGLLFANVAAGSVVSSQVDAAIYRNAVGVLEINNGAMLVNGGTLADLKLRSLIYGAPAADGQASGPITSDFNCGYTSSVIGELVYLDATFTWQKASASPSTPLYKYMLGIALEVKATGQAMKVALPGATVWASAKLPTLNNGPVFMSETPGEMTQTEPSTPDSATRCVGWGVHADKMYFFPSPDYGTHL